MDIREKPSLTHEDVVSLNFIRSPGRYFFRRHYRMGLRSHIMEVLDPAEVDLEKRGLIKDGIRRFPRARPKRMLRIFRTKFASLKDAEQEIERVKMVQHYLSPEFVARSEEFLVDYRKDNASEILLCGLQAFVEGEILDPWTPAERHPIEGLLRRINQGVSPTPYLVEKAIRNILEFVARIKAMVQGGGHVPDLAGVGNLLLTRKGDVMLVDINNISRIRFDERVPLDDRGYPVCDKSIQALFLLEKKSQGQTLSKQDPLYEHFLNPARMHMVRELERQFHTANLANSSYNPGVDVRAF